MYFMSNQRRESEMFRQGLNNFLVKILQTDCITDYENQSFRNLESFPYWNSMLVTYRFESIGKMRHLAHDDGWLFLFVRNDFGSCIKELIFIQSGKVTKKLLGDCEIIVHKMKQKIHSGGDKDMILCSRGKWHVC